MRNWKLCAGGWICALILVLLSVTSVQPAIPADSSAEISADTKYLALTFDDGPKQVPLEYIECRFLSN